MYAPHVLKQAVVDNVDHDKKYDSLDGKAVVAVSTVKEENHEEAKVHKHTLQNLNKVLEMFVDAGANVDETYQIDPSVSSIYTPSLSSRDGGSPTSSASASPKKDAEDFDGIVVAIQPSISAVRCVQVSVMRDALRNYWKLSLLSIASFFRF